MAQLLKIFLFGSFRIVSPSGELIHLPTRKAVALIAYLAIEQQGVSRDRMAGLLWPDNNDERSRHNLRQVLSKVRRLCGPIIQTHGDTLKLDAASCIVDVVEFCRLANVGDDAGLRACIETYSGELLDGYVSKELEYEDWLLVTRQKLNGIFCHCLDRLVKNLIATKTYDEAIKLSKMRLVMDPICELAHRSLMELYHLSSRTAEAIRQYHQCEKTLFKELGEQPCEITTRLYQTIASTLSKTAIHNHAIYKEQKSRRGELPRVAVLPLKNLSSQVEDYFSDGMTEDIITALSRFHSLQVIARGSCFVYKNKSESDREIAEALGARYLVCGSIQRSGKHIRLNIQLLDGSSGLNIWTHRFDRELIDVFAVQDEITATIVSTLAGRVEANQVAQNRRVSEERLEAYDCLLKGKDHHHKYTAEDCAKCIELFNQAIDCDPTFAVAHAWLACGLGQAIIWNLDDQSHLVDQAQKAAERGLELDDDESECHRILAQVWLTRGDIRRSLIHQEKAILLNPNDDRIVCSMGEILIYDGRALEAEQWVRESLILNPYHPQRYWTHLVRALIHQQKFEEALRIFQQIGRPRQDDFVYALVASAQLKDKYLVRDLQTTLRTSYPDFDPLSFSKNLPYVKIEDQNLILDSIDMANQLGSHR